MALLIGACARGQVLRNGDFDEGCDTCGTGCAGWSISWAGPGVSCTRDRSALLISCKDSVDAVGFVEQSITIPEVKEPLVAGVTAMVSLSQLTGKGASLNIACYDADGGFLTNKDFGIFPFMWGQGTRPPEPWELKLVLPLGTTRVNVGAIVNGRGDARFDDFALQLSPIAGRTPDAYAKAYVNAACDTIKHHAVYRDSVDIDALRPSAWRIAGAENDPNDHHLAVEYLLHALGDHHSFLMSREHYDMWKREPGAGSVAFPTHRVIQGCGYVSVPGFFSGDSITMIAFADSLQHGLEKMAAQGIEGWIVDLRKNTGGNMAPMVCGLGPLLDPGVLGTLTDTHGTVQRWSYHDGDYGWDGVTALRLTKPVHLARKLPVAVLTSSQTGSSGECVTISFIGNSRTRSFGQATLGLVTGNGEFELPDGARMFMASTIMGDRNGTLFHGPIAPNEPVEQPADWSYDASLDAAAKWIRAQD